MDTLGVMNPRRILFIASEAAPLVKVGGLADVVGALPPALRALGHDVRILLPKYEVIRPELIPIQRTLGPVSIPWQGKSLRVTVQVSTLVGTDVPLYLLDAPEMFAGEAIYYEHNGPGGMRLALERYVFFSWAVGHVLPILNWSPHILHCHDWHTAALPAVLTTSAQPAPVTILTIHNMEGQGKWSPAEIFSWLGLHGDESPLWQLRDQANNLNLLQLGIHGADAVTTVSPTYAKEIVIPEFGAGLETDLASRRGGVMGILNGIDAAHFNPAVDASLHARYDSQSVTVGKLANRRALLRELQLDYGLGPLFGFVGRLTGQKGVDLISAAVPDIVRGGGNLVVLGSGSPDIERAIKQAAADFPGAVRAVVKFDAQLAQRIYAASDFFLMPSRFEPCGLGQMIAMCYGALPIVRDTGGLHDTVSDLREAAGGTGLVFRHSDPQEFRDVIHEALRLYAEVDTMTMARQRGMSQDFSWTRSAQAYGHLYRHVHPTA